MKPTLSGTPLVWFTNVHYFKEKKTGGVWVKWRCKQLPEGTIVRHGYDTHGRSFVFDTVVYRKDLVT